MGAAATWGLHAIRHAPVAQQLDALERERGPGAISVFQGVDTRTAVAAATYSAGFAMGKDVNFFLRASGELAENRGASQGKADLRTEKQHSQMGKTSYQATPFAATTTSTSTPGARMAGSPARTHTRSRSEEREREENHRRTA